VSFGSRRASHRFRPISRPPNLERLPIFLRSFERDLDSKSIQVASTPEKHQAPSVMIQKSIYKFSHPCSLCLQCENQPSPE
jgi:hypothetical protein